MEFEMGTHCGRTRRESDRLVLVARRRRRSGCREGADCSHGDGLSVHFHGIQHDTNHPEHRPPALHRLDDRSFVRSWERIAHDHVPDSLSEFVRCPVCDPAPRRRQHADDWRPLLRGVHHLACLRLGADGPRIVVRGWLWSGHHLGCPGGPTDLELGRIQSRQGRGFVLGHLLVLRNRRAGDRVCRVRGHELARLLPFRDALHLDRRLVLPGPQVP
mmetsp:Transcript_345/g.1055  ORF Transcript_345/g.1055 Transcript_345/m.1055 type:complete len:216 (+) Transcript_345:191-838(+)